MQWQIVKRVAELDAIFAYLYGLNTEDLRYILDPMLKTEDIHPPKTGISVHFSGSLV